MTPRHDAAADTEGMMGTSASKTPSATGHHRAADDQRLRKDIGTIGLLFSAVGSIIGSGWLFGALKAAQIAGPAAVFSWAVGAVMIMLIGLCYAELGTMFPVSGGVIRFPHYAFGSFASYTLGWITWLGTASVSSIEVLAALQYSTNYLPWLQHLQNGTPVLTLPGLGVAVAMLALFSLVNVIGIRWFARLNTALVWWKLAIIVLTVAALSAAAFSSVNFTRAASGGFAPYGWSSVFSSIATSGIVFSYLGFRQGVELAGESHHPQRNVPIAIIGSTVITGIIYVLLEIAFVGALPGRALLHGWAHVGTSFNGGAADIAAAFGPLAALATVLGLGWLALLLYIDAVISPADTGLIYTTATVRVSYAMGRNANSPRSLARVNERGVPWVSVIVTFFIASIFFLPFPGWQKLVGFVTSATVLSYGSGPLSLLAMRRHLPHQERPFRLPAKWPITYLAFLSSNLIVYWSGWDTVWKLMLAVLIGYVVLAIYELRYARITPPFELRSGLWVVLWLAGLTLLSWLGSFPQVSSHAGNLGLMSFSGSLGVFAVFSALILWVAVSSSLSGERMLAQLVADPGGEPPPEQAA